MAEQLSVRTSVVQGSHPVYQRHSSTTQPLWYTRFPLSCFFQVGSLVTKGSTHALVDLLLTQCVVFEGHGSLSTIDFGRECIV